MLLVHGFASNKDSKSWSPLLKKLHQNKIATFRIDLSARGESEGEFENVTVTNDTQDVLAAIGYLKNQGYYQIGLVGSSFGGLASIMAVVGNDDVFCLVLKCPVTDWLQTYFLQKPGILEQWNKEGFLCFEHDPSKPRMAYAAVLDAQKNIASEVASKIKIPTLVVHGDKDEMVPYEGSHGFVKLLPNGKLHTIKGGLHHLRKNPKHSVEENKVISEFIVRQVNHIKAMTI